MAEITLDCAAELDMVKSPCSANDYGYPVKLVIGHPDGTLTVAGESPTLAEIQTGIADTGVNKLIVLENITNGNRIESSLEEEEGADTADGLRSVFGVNVEVSGRIKLLDEEIRADLAKLGLYDRLQVWVITSGGWIFGGKTGYKVSNFISPMYSEGFGTRAYHAFSFIYRNNKNATDPAGEDEGFLDLTNPATT